ncbi:Flagellar biosynthesis protein FliQ [hydrothermal vent metagenome]|uniref:Flagellar biosynthetic protein FliQ n=1 Tax=hydrothermal vent metagenome TaxID=652676 RepID=A0A3B0UU43_9ZZZZ
MTPELVISIGKTTIDMALTLSVPILLCGMAVGLTVSIFQAVTQIQEITLTFVPKIIAVFLALLIFSSWMIEMMVQYTTNLFVNIPNYIR